MDWYETCRKWCRYHSLIENRVRCLGWVVGDAVSMTGRAGCYSLTLWGRAVAEWRCYDLESVKAAFRSADLLLQALWDARREGFATC